MHLNALFPAAHRVAIKSVRITPTQCEVEVGCTAEAASCLICQVPSRRVHSRYIRVVQDLPWGGLPMILRFWTRRFFCDNIDCRRRIFAEQLPALARPRARGTPRLDQSLVRIGLECGGEPGRRLCGDLGITASGDTILRRLRATPQANVHCGNVIGVDDFAFRRGQRYGTMIVDHESGGVIDLLPDRTSASLEVWLTARPTLPTVVTRDRSGVYAKAITIAAPDAVQVADRWHLLANCREALVRVIDRHHSSITQAMAATRSVVSTADQPQNAAESELTPPPTAVPPTLPPPVPPVPAVLSRSRQLSIDRRARRVARYEQVLELRRQGVSQRTIASQLKLGRGLVRRLVNADSFPERAKTHHTRQVDRYIDQLRLQWAQGIRNARELAESIRTLGYTGSNAMVRRCVAPWRTPAERPPLRGPTRQSPSPVPLDLQRPSSNRLSWLLTKDDLARRTGEAELLAELGRTCEPIHTASELARSFAPAVQGREINVLTAWMERAAQSTSTKEMNGFAEGLTRNWPEVKAAVELPWSNGRTEGHVNRLKLIKRKMYGRAKFDLLRIRVMARGP